MKWVISWLILIVNSFYLPYLLNLFITMLCWCLCPTFKESGTLVGTVVNVVNTGANDVLQVRCHSTGEGIDWLNSTKPESSASGHLVWIPFVEAIVPHVDMDNREMWITPPKGLLELNLHSDPRSKKERRQLVSPAALINFWTLIHKLYFNIWLALCFLNLYPYEASNKIYFHSSMARREFKCSGSVLVLIHYTLKTDKGIHIDSVSLCCIVSNSLQRIPGLHVV